VAGSLHDLYGNGCVAPNNTTTFAGPGACMPSAVVISQVYGGGGNTGATYKNDFIELHNRSSSAQAIGGWSVQYASAAGTTWSATPIPAGTLLAPGAYFLIQEASGGTPGIALPTADATGTTNLSGTSGKVALVSNATALTGSCPAGSPVVDLLGYGTANCSEGTAAAALTNTTSALRATNGCGDTNMNSTDFSAGTPNARNTGSTAALCGCN
jgi:predicted extracellular nuclease